MQWSWSSSPGTAGKMKNWRERRSVCCVSNNWRNEATNKKQTIASVQDRHFLMISSLVLFHEHLGSTGWPCGRLLDICANFLIRNTIWFLFCCNYCPVFLSSHCRIARIAILHSGHAMTFRELLHMPTSYRSVSYTGQIVFLISICAFFHLNPGLRVIIWHQDHVCLGQNVALSSYRHTVLSVIIAVSTQCRASGRNWYLVGLVKYVIRAADTGYVFEQLFG